MSDRYPDWETYETMYHKYIFGRDPAELFDVAVMGQGGHLRDPSCLRGRRIIDLCAGTGRLSAAAFEYGAAFVCAVEQEMRMLKPDNFGLEWISNTSLSMNSDTLLIINKGVAEAVSPGSEIDKGTYDFAFCQQAVNYWFEEAWIRELSRCLKPNREGVFVFSTFNAKPATKPKVREYWEAGRHYVEVSQLTKDLSGQEWVEHVQICEGYAPHATRFKWIAPDEYEHILSKFFNVKRIRDGKSDIYRCETFRTE